MMKYFTVGKRRKQLLLSVCLSLSFLTANAQTPRALVATGYASNTRAADGRPGNEYWQNRADYRIAVTFDTTTRQVQGVADITYTNNSPQVLPYLWMLLSQNRFREDSRVALLTPANGSRFGVQEYTAGCVIRSLQTGANASSMQATGYQVTDTYLKVMLPAPLLPGKQVHVKIAYQFQLPYNGSDYMGIVRTAQGAVYQVSGLFPRMSVYDDVHGWNALGSSYMVEPGSLDVSITVPAGLIVQGTGELKNPEAVLSPAQLIRYRLAWMSDSVVCIRNADEITGTNTRKMPGMRTWHFTSPNAGDGMWGISSAFIWDAVRVNLPGGRTTLAMALYPQESHQDWTGITMQMKQMLEMYSHVWTPYPYTTAVNIAGSVTGIAAPGVSVIDYQKSKPGNTLWTKTNHELGHSWFNIMIAADSRNAWMSEGLNTFINLLNCDTLNGPPAFTIPDAIRRLSVDTDIPALNTPYAAVRPGIMAMVMYIKPAVALYLLRNKIIGNEKFDRVFRGFMNDWAFKHPAPADFFNAMENGTGEDLGWFWQGWFLNDWKLDQAVKKVEYVNNDPAQGVNITLVNRRQQIMPVDVTIHEAGRMPAILHFPAQLWQADTVHTFHYVSTAPLESVVIDPGNELPDLDRSNNTWTPSSLNP